MIVDKIFMRIEESIKLQLHASKKRLLNKLLQDLTSGVYFPRVPMDKIQRVLKRVGVTPVTKGDEVWDGEMYWGSRGKVTVDLSQGQNEHGSYIIINNALFVMTWYKMPETGNYEIVAYVS